MRKIKNTWAWFRTQPATGLFAIVALLSGFLFLNRGITGNIILSDKYSFDVVSLIGLLLILCSAVLGMYSVRKKSK